MAVGSVLVFSDSITSGASTSAGVDLVHGFNGLGFQIGTMSTSAALSLQNSNDGGTTYYNVFQTTINSSTVTTQQIIVGSSVGTNGGYVNMTIDALKRIRFVASGTVTNGVQFKVVCTN